MITHRKLWSFFWQLSHTPPCLTLLLLLSRLRDWYFSYVPLAVLNVLSVRSQVLKNDPGERREQAGGEGVSVWQTLPVPCCLL